MKPPGVTVDSTRHPTGTHALWDEVCRLRRLLRQGETLADQLEALAVESHPALYERSQRWRQEVREVMGGCP